jgi:hypothetical protein
LTKGADFCYGVFGMSEPSTPVNNLRKSDPNSAGQMILLVCAVVAAVVFGYLYITGRPQAKGGPADGTAEQSVPRPPAPDKTLVSHEPTQIEVEQVLLVSPSEGAAAEKVLVRTPAVYPTGTLQWKAAQVEAARNLQTRLVNVLRHQAAIERELARIESEWQRLALDGLPLEVLYPDSPSLPQVSTVPTSPPAP